MLTDVINDASVRRLHKRVNLLGDRVLVRRRSNKGDRRDQRAHVITGSADTRGCDFTRTFQRNVRVN